MGYLLINPHQSQKISTILVYQKLNNKHGSTRENHQDSLNRSR